MGDITISTFDNPWSPFTEFEQWSQFDNDEKHYHSWQTIGRIIDTIENKEDYDEDLVREIAIRDLVEHNPLGVHILMTREMADNLIKNRKNMNF